MTAECVVPLRTVSALNQREHFRVRARRVKRERQVTRLALLADLGQGPTSSRIAPSFVGMRVILTRVAPRALDEGDNLSSSLKGVRDEVADWLGVDDGPKSGLTWVYAQERGAAREYAVRIYIDGGV